MNAVAERIAGWKEASALGRMPDVYGLEAIRRLRANPALRDVAVIAFTAYAMKGDEQKMLAAGCDGYIAKPIDIARFGASVRACLRLGGVDGAST